MPTSVGPAAGSSSSRLAVPFVVALETGWASWTELLNAVRLGSAGGATAVTATQPRFVVARLMYVGPWREGDPEIWVVMDSGYEVAFPSHTLADLPVVLVARLHSDGAMRPERRGYGKAKTMAWDRKPSAHPSQPTAKPQKWANFPSHTARRCA